MKKFNNVQNSHLPKLNLIWRWREYVTMPINTEVVVLVCVNFQMVTLLKKPQARNAVRKLGWPELYFAGFINGRCSR